MTKMVWDQIGERLYETGVDHGALYLPNGSGVYDTGFPWNGLTAVTESPEGAEATPQYADNIKYLNLVSAEDFNGTIEAFTYPSQFEQCDGTAELTPGVTIGQQSRKTFGLSYRTLLGNDLEGTDYGYKLHLVYGALAAPSEKARNTVNDTPEAVSFSWEFSTTPVEVGTIGETTYKPTAKLTIDSTKVDSAALASLETMLYGSAGQDPRLPTPAEVYALFANTLVQVTPVAPTFDDVTDTVTIPSVTGVEYRIDDEVVTGDVVIEEYTLVVATAATGYYFAPGVDVDWAFEPTGA